MSYRESYSASVPYSGSVSYSYPASERGGSGTVPYRGVVPIHVTINVNTDPFDGSVHSFNNSIDELAGSVVAMNAAQCAAIQQTTRDISQSLINGFFGTINTELSQQLQALDSAIKAGLGLIMEQRKAVSGIKDVMESDYNRISSRYGTLFADLENECYKRIYALDKQSFNLSENISKQLISESATNAAALNLLGVQDESSAKMLIMVSGLNRKTIEVLKTLRDYITQESRLNSLFNSFLFNETNEIVEENTTFYIPVIWIESDLIDGKDASQESFITQHINQEEKEKIVEKTNVFCSDPSRTTWNSIDETEKTALHREFNGLAETHFADTTDETEQRIYKTMLSLWQNADLLSLERSI